MEIKVLGCKLSIINLVFLVILGVAMVCLVTGSCGGYIKPIHAKTVHKKVLPGAVETFRNKLPDNAAPLNYYPNQNQKGSWMSKALQYAGNMGYQSILQRHEKYKGTPVPLENTMYYFKDNKFDPSCCPTTYTSGTGCACTSVPQMVYLNERGGNRTLPSNF